MIRRLLMFAALGLAVGCATPSPRSAMPGDPREKDEAFRYGRNPGPSPVGAIPDVLLDDAARNRQVKVSIDYPTRGGPHPLIVFSHAAGSSNRGYPGLSSHWASYGYVVIRPAHPDRSRAGELTAAEWHDRARDLSFVIDSLPKLEELFPELQGRIDANRIAVAGHSRGATTALMLGGLRTFPGPVSSADRRVKAVAALSPHGPREAWGMTTESYAGIQVPALIMTGTRDVGAAEDETPQWRQQVYELSPPGDKWLVTIDDVQHFTFTGEAGPVREAPRVTPRIDPTVDPVAAQRQAERERVDRARRQGIDQRSQFDAIRSLALAFFDAYLRDDPKGKDSLREADARESVEVRSK